MTSLRAVELARWFWAAVGGAPPFPREPRRALALSLPVTVIDLPGLTVARMAGWLAAHRVAGPVATADRPLRAGLLTTAGQGLIFLDSNDPADEQRFSLAHELAHLLADDWQQRAAVASRVGPGALEVLDGRRRPTQAERIDALLAGLELRPRLHLMERTASGHLPNQHLSAAERLADELALELLAPIEVVGPLASATSAELTALLGSQFGLPVTLAAAYAARLTSPDDQDLGTEFLRRLGLKRARPASHSGPPARKEE